MNFNLHKRISRKNRLLVLIACGGMAATGTLMATAPRHDDVQAQEKAWPVSARLVEPADLSPELRLFGRVETANHAQLTAAVTATVQNVNVSEGERVHKGQVLLILDDADEQLHYQQRLADTEQAAADLESTRAQLDNDQQVLSHMRELLELSRAKRARHETLRQSNVMALEQLEDTRVQLARQAILTAQQQLKVDDHPQRLAAAQARLNRTQALLQEQELTLSRTIILSPFEGRISEITVAPGERVMEGQQLLSLYDTDALRVRATIPGSNVVDVKRALREGAPIYARIASAEGVTQLRLKQLAGEVRRGSAGVDGLFEIRSEKVFLELGRAVDMTIVLPVLEQVAAVPVRSIHGDDRVYTIVDGRLQAIAVSNMGQRVNSAGELEILLRAPELQTATPILTTSLPRASSGLRVEVISG
jgi:multidrug efflux pump subunit AcrA (membrane-fusion protein)